MNEKCFSSLSFKINDELKEKIIKWGIENIKDQNVFNHASYSHLGREENTHCTVLYNITDNDPKKIKKVLNNEPSFDIELGEISIFEHDLFEVVKINVHGEGVYRLHRVAKNSINYRSLYYNFSPHITIAFIKKGTGKQLLQEINKRIFVGKIFKVKNLCFKLLGKEEIFIDLIT